MSVGMMGFWFYWVWLWLACLPQGTALRCYSQQAITLSKVFSQTLVATRQLSARSSETKKPYIKVKISKKKRLRYQEKPKVASSPSAASKALPQPIDIDGWLQQMSDEEKVGQLLFVGFSGTQFSEDMRHWIVDRQVGGVVLFSRNIVNVHQTVQLTSDLWRGSQQGLPIFIAVDQEGGNVIRIRDGTILLPGNMALGATRQESLAYLAGLSLGQDLKTLGFNMNLAPVLDINSNPKNPVIGIRSYGEQPQLVGGMGQWFIRGQQEMGISSVAKHFPGHGDTQIDSHEAMPTIDANLQRLLNLELKPFQQAIAANLDAIMTAHIAVPQVVGSKNLPATLSHVFLSDILRQRLGFEGIIVTDGLEMRSIVQQHGSGRAAVLAVLAGADMPMVLWSEQAREEVYQYLIRAVHQGEISSQRLDASVRRILQIKYRRGLFQKEHQEPPTADLLANHSRWHGAIVERIAQQSVTLLRHDEKLLPYDSNQKTALLLAPAGPLMERFSQHANTYALTMPYEMNRSTKGRLLKEANAMASHVDLLLAAVVNRSHMDLVRTLSQANPALPTVLISLASPYYLQWLPQAKGYICTYSYLDAAQKALGEALLGEIPFQGFLPVSIPGFYGYGQGIQTLPLKHQQAVLSESF